jgi:signal transduction histidine kinase
VKPRDEPPALPSTRLRGDELELISMVGHELRNPLTVIRGAATLLLQAQEQMPLERRQAMLRLIEQHTEAMSDLVEDLITVAHLEASDTDLMVEDVEVVRVIEKVVEWARRQDSRPIVVLGSDPGVKARGDRERIEQVLRALVGNALRHAPTSDIEILVRRSGGQVKIGVLDRGPGIPKADREHVFERFARGGELSNSGAGLGLYVARGLARVMDGDVTLETRPEGGSAFWFTLGRSA